MIKIMKMMRKMIARAETVTMYGKSHGIPRFICVCIVIKFAKTPKFKPAATHMIRSQKFS